MASLVGAVYKGTTKAASATVGAAYSKVAGEIPTPSRAIYNLGLGIGPILESIVSEMSKGKPKPSQNQNQDVSTKATAEGLRMVAVQISSLSNIMSDLRNIALMQLKENKASNQRLRQLEVQKRFGEQEDIIEKIKAPLSSLVSPKGDKQGEGVLGDFSSAMGMIKTGLAVALSAFLVDRFLPETSKAIKDSVRDAYNYLSPIISENIRDAFNEALKEIPGLARIKELFAWLEGLDKKLRETFGDPAIDTALKGLLAAGVTSMVLKRFGVKNVGKYALGAGAAVAGANILSEEGVSPVDAAITAGQGVAATAVGAGAYSVTKRLFGKSTDESEDGGKGKSKGPISIQPPSATPPQVPVLSRGDTSSVGGGRSAANDPTKVKENVYERLKRDTVPKLQEILKKIPMPTFLKIVGTRVGVVAASAMAASVALGPLGMILAAISLTTTVYTLIELIDLLYESLDSAANNVSKAPVTSLVSSPEQQARNQAIASSKPGVTDQTTLVPPGTPFDLDRYMSTVAQRESGGDIGAKNPFSSASGKFQFLRGTYEGDSTSPGIRNLDPRLQGVSFEEFNKREDLQDIAMKILTNMNYDFMKAKLGREPTEEEMYLAHFLGANGAYKLIKSAEKGEAVSSAVSSKVMMANPNMFPSGSESSTTVLNRIKGYYEKGKVSKLGAPGPVGLSQPFNPNNIASEVGRSTEDFMKHSESLAGSVSASLKNLMSALEGTFSMNDGKSTTTEFTASGPSQSTEPSALNTFSSEKDKIMIFTLDKGYYGSR